MGGTAVTILRKKNKEGGITNYAPSSYKTMLQGHCNHNSMFLA